MEKKPVNVNDEILKLLKTMKKKPLNVAQLFQKAKKGKKEYEELRQWIKEEQKKEKFEPPLKQRILETFDKIIAVDGHKQPWQNKLVGEQKPKGKGLFGMGKKQKKMLKEESEESEESEEEMEEMDAGCCGGKKMNKWLCYLSEFRKKHKGEYNAKEMLKKASEKYNKGEGLEQINLDDVKMKGGKKGKGYLASGKMIKENMIKEILELAKMKNKKGAGLKDVEKVVDIEGGRKKAKQEMKRMAEVKAFDEDVFNEQKSGRALTGVSKMNQWRYNSDYLEDNRQKAYYQYLDKIRNMF
jgi:hypothetical protein